jgi:hypothetical protein
MNNIIVNTITGAMVLDDGNLGIKGNLLKEYPACVTVAVTDAVVDQLKRKHCTYIDGEIVVLPESEWPENRVEEEPVEEEV